MTVHTVLKFSLQGSVGSSFFQKLIKKLKVSWKNLLFSQQDKQNQNLTLRTDKPKLRWFSLWSLEIYVLFKIKVSVTSYRSLYSSVFYVGNNIWSYSLSHLLMIFLSFDALFLFFLNRYVMTAGQSFLVETGLLKVWSPAREGSCLSWGPHGAATSQPSSWSAADSLFSAASKTRANSHLMLFWLKNCSQNQKF